MDFPPTKGVWITGRVVDDATGLGLPNESVEYHPFKDNPDLRKDLEAGFSPQVGWDSQTDRTGKGGTFRIRGYPGRGIVTAGDEREYLQGVGTDTIQGLKPEEYVNSLYNTERFNPYHALSRRLS